jgi:hypothetical protein
LDSAAGKVNDGINLHPVGTTRFNAFLIWMANLRLPPNARMHATLLAPSFQSCLRPSFDLRSDLPFKFPFRTRIGVLSTKSFEPLKHKFVKARSCIANNMICFQPLAKLIDNV